MLELVNTLFLLGDLTAQVGHVVECVGVPFVEPFFCPREQRLTGPTVLKDTEDAFFLCISRSVGKWVVLSTRPVSCTALILPYSSQTCPSPSRMNW